MKGAYCHAQDQMYKGRHDAGLRFPSFWGPVFDWTPDHSWGGSSMIGLQEMLTQADGKQNISVARLAQRMEWKI